MKTFIRTSLIAATIIGVSTLSLIMPAEARRHHNYNQDYANAAAMQMYANNVAIQQEQAAMYGGYGYGNPYHHNYGYGSGYINPYNAGHRYWHH